MGEQPRRVPDRRRHVQARRVDRPASRIRRKSLPNEPVPGRYSNGGQDVGQSGPRGAGDAGRSASRGAVTRQGRPPGHRPGPWRGGLRQVAAAARVPVAGATTTRHTTLYGACIDVSAGDMPLVPFRTALRHLVQSSVDDRDGITPRWHLAGPARAAARAGAVRRARRPGGAARVRGRLRCRGEVDRRAHRGARRGRRAVGRP